MVSFLFLLFSFVTDFFICFLFPFEWMNLVFQWTYFVFGVEICGDVTEIAEFWQWSNTQTHRHAHTARTTEKRGNASAKTTTIEWRQNTKIESRCVWERRKENLYVSLLGSRFRTIISTSNYGWMTTTVFFLALFEKRRMQAKKLLYTKRKNFLLSQKKTHNHDDKEKKNQNQNWFLLWIVKMKKKNAFISLL